MDTQRSGPMTASVRILWLRLKHFRNYEDALFEFGPGLNVLCGPNGSGKTTLLEAIYVLMTGRSFRCTHLKELVRHGAQGFFIELAFVKHGVRQSLRMFFDQGERKLFHNQTACGTLSAWIGILPGVVLLPDDLQLIKGAPTERRKYLDLQLAQSDPLYVHHLTRYQRALSQRNLLLKSKQIQTIEVWEEELAKAGGYIHARRLGALGDLQQAVSRLAPQLSPGQEEIGLHYAGQCPPDPQESILYYQTLYQKARPRELYLGHTLVGPHKDDLRIAVHHKAARQFCSEGQMRTCAIALRLAEWEFIRLRAEADPLMLVDDFGMNLDPVRRESLLQILCALGQVFLTTTEDLPLDPQVEVIRIRN